MNAHCVRPQISSVSCEQRKELKESAVIYFHTERSIKRATDPQGIFGPFKMSLTDNPSLTILKKAHRPKLTEHTKFMLLPIIGSNTTWCAELFTDMSMNNSVHLMPANGMLMTGSLNQVMSSI